MEPLLSVEDVCVAADKLPPWGGLHVVLRESELTEGFRIWWFDPEHPMREDTLMGRLSSPEFSDFAQAVAKRYGVNTLAGVIGFLRFVKDPKHGPNWTLQCSPSLGEIINAQTLQALIGRFA